MLRAVVCAGVKSVLDVPRTLEFLETQGVTVAAFGAGISTATADKAIHSVRPH